MDQASSHPSHFQPPHEDDRSPSQTLHDPSLCVRRGRSDSKGEGRSKDMEEGRGREGIRRRGGGEKGQGRSECKGGGANDLHT